MLLVLRRTLLWFLLAVNNSPVNQVAVVGEQQLLPGASWLGQILKLTVDQLALVVNRTAHEAVFVDGIRLLLRGLAAT